jgi:hypothetical protein
VIRAAVLGAATLAADPALAQRGGPGTEHSIPWFEANPLARERTIRACRDDYRFADEGPSRAVCANAEAAENRAHNRGRGWFHELDTPSYWQESPGRAAALRAACARRAEFDRPMLRYCGLRG